MKKIASQLMPAKSWKDVARIYEWNKAHRQDCRLVIISLKGYHPYRWKGYRA